jgi:WD40 repeat protein
MLSPDNISELEIVEQAQLESITDLAFTPVWNVLITSHTDGWLLRWGLDDGSRPWAIHHHDDWVYEVDFGPGGFPLGTASRDGTIWYWANPGRNLFPIEAHDGEVTSIAIYGYDEIAFGSEDNTVWVIAPDLSADESGFKEVLGQLFGHTNWVWDVEFSPSGEILASASADGTIRLWDPEAFTEIKTLEGHQGTVWRLDFTPDGSALASAGWDATARIWIPETGELQHVLQHDSPVWSVAFSLDGKLLATGTGEGKVYLWHAESGELLRILDAHTDVVRGLEFSPDGWLLASASEDGGLRLWGVTD